MLGRPLNVLVGQIESAKFDSIKKQIANRIVEMARSEELSTSVSTYVSDALERFRPQTLGSALQLIDPDAIQRAKIFLIRSLLTLLSRDDTARTINASQFELERLWLQVAAGDQSRPSCRVPARPGRTDNSGRAKRCPPRLPR